MALLSGQRPAGEGGHITGQASSLPKALTFSLTQDRVFGESQIAKSDIPRLRPACDPPLQAGFVFLGSRLSLSPSFGIGLPLSAGVKQLLQNHATPITRPASTAFLSASRMTGGTSQSWASIMAATWAIRSMIGLSRKSTCS